MIDEIPFFVWITSVNPLLIQKNRTRIAGELFSQEESKDGKPFGAMNTTNESYYKRSHTTTTDMIEKSRKESFNLL